jgi:hypothetical protein
VEESTTSHDGRVDRNIKTSCLWLHVKVICFQRMQAALADERGGMGTFLEFAGPTCGRREGFASVRQPWKIVYTVISFQGLICFQHMQTAIADECWFK